MKVEQIYTGCLAQGAYYIECDGEVAIIDPLREVQHYIDIADRAHARIKYIFETHFHADFVSGHLTLSDKTGAPIIYGPQAKPDFQAVIAEDGQEFPLGSAVIKTLHTPGHTLESTTWLLRNQEGKDVAIFTGDTLFLGDVGRPDLAQKQEGLTAETLAATLYDSLREKIMPLADDVIVYPGHGAGSACGKHMMKETVDTLGSQKKRNYALRIDLNKDEFIKELLDGLDPPPAYFPLNVKLNREGYESIDAVVGRGDRPLTPDEFESIAEASRAVMLDVRHQSEFSKSHIPNSIFIGLDGGFAPWVGALIRDTTQPILLIVDKNRVEEAITRLSRVGFDHCLGYLQGGIEAWRAAGKDVETIQSISAEEFVKLQSKASTLGVVDVRKPEEYTASHVTGARNFPLSDINEYLKAFGDDHPHYIHCAAGYRSVIAASILKSRGIHHIIDVRGGFGAISELIPADLVESS